jgi:hypothetical protein
VPVYPISNVTGVGVEELEAHAAGRTPCCSAHRASASRRC